MVRDICWESPKTVRVTNRLKDSRATASIASVSLQKGNKTAPVSQDFHKLREGRWGCTYCWDQTSGSGISRQCPGRSQWIRSFGLEFQPSVPPFCHNSCRKSPMKAVKKRPSAVTEMQKSEA